MRKVIMMAMVALAAVGAQAANYSLTASDASKASSFTDFNVSGTTQYGVPTPENDYFTAGWTIRTPTSTQWVTFEGNSLHIGSLKDNKSGVLADCKSGKQSLTFNGDGLFLEKGRISTWGANREMTLDGNLTVLARKGDFWIGGDSANNICSSNVIKSTMWGDQDAWLIFKEYNSAKSTPWLVLNSSGDKMGGYQGTLEIYGDTDTDKSGNYGAKWTVQVESEVNCPGQLILHSGSLLRTRWGTGRVNFGKLKLNAGSKVNVRYGSGTVSLYRATDRLEVEDGAHVVMADGLPGITASIWYPFLAWDANATASFDLDKLVFEDTRTALRPYKLPTTYFAVSNDVTEAGGSLVGTNYIVLVQKPLVFIKADSSAANNENSFVQSSLTNATKFSDGQLPHAGADYYVSKSDYPKGYNGYRLLTPQPEDLPNGIYAFPGDSLTIGTNCEFKSMAKVLNVKSLRLLDATQFFPRITGSPSELNGDELFIGPVEGDGSAHARILVYYNNTWTCNAPLTGSGIVQFMANAGSSVPNGTAVLAKPSSDFLGRIWVTASTWNETKLSAAVNECVRVSDAYQLGGALPAFTADALRLENWGTVEATEDVDFSTANRGVSVGNFGQLRVAEGKTLTIGNVVTFDGVLHKTGDGRLVFGAPSAKAADESTAELVVDEGTVAVAHDEALKAVTISFAEGTSLVIDKTSASKTGAVVGGVNGALRAALASDSDDYTVSNLALCTVPEGVSVAVARPKHHRVKLSSKSNGDGTVTWFADVEKTGFALVVR